MGIYMMREFVIPNYLCFTANTSGSRLSLGKYGNPTSVSLETSTDGINWSAYNFGTTINVPVGDKLYWRNTSSTTTGFSTGTSNYYYFNIVGSIAASGDVTYLINKNSTDVITTDYCFFDLFAGDIGLTSCPELRATTLTPYCYGNMFFYCSNIRLSTTQTGDYQTPYRIPTTGTGTISTNSLQDMFTGTGGTFTGTPTINTTYYTSNTVV